MSIWCRKVAAIIKTALLATARQAGSLDPEID
jgi:hypothetical protein